MPDLKALAMGFRALTSKLTANLMGAKIPFTVREMRLAAGLTAMMKEPTGADWQPGKLYDADNTCMYNSTRYYILFTHISQEGTTPDITTELYRQDGPIGA